VSASITLRRAAAAAILFGVGSFGFDAQAQRNAGPPNALQGFSQNRDQPIRIRAAALEVRDKERIATFTGDVHLVNGDTELRCRAMVVFYDEESAAAGGPKPASAGPAGGQQIRRIEAKGGVAVAQKDQNATGDTAVFNMRENTVALTGNVVVTRGQDVLRGQRLMVNLTTGVSKMDGGRVDVLIDTRKK
jgi:lipopolysaccharide export system protein LptA